MNDSWLWSVRRLPRAARLVTPMREAMTKAAWLVGVALCVLNGLSGCNFGPSEERLGCLNGCAAEKDQCMLNAMTPQGIQACDARARQCTEPCPQ